MNTKRLIRQSLLAAVSILCVAAVTAGGARESLKFIPVPYGGNCGLHKSALLYIENTHPERTVEVHLEYYLGGVRQAGRSVKVLKSGAEPVALGCTQVSGLDQRWKIVEAEFQN